MADLEIDKALASDQTIPREKVVSWISASSDLRTLSKLYRLTRDRYYQIQPELGGPLTCALIQRYLLQCVQQDVKDEKENLADSDKIRGRWEAAESLHIWFRYLIESGNNHEVLTTAAKAVTEVFLSGSDGVRDAIETGFLEHALETEGLWPYFENWREDPRLKEAWERALEWGKAHPNFMWGMLQELRKLQK
jgi:hypothetical protein